jgi:lipopolysaccharide export system protein LptA
MNKIKNWGYIVAIILSLTLTISPHLFAKDKKNPVEINSDRMRSEDGGLKIIFSGNVVGYWGDLKITCDILEVYNTKDKKETEEIVALGNVFITRGLKRAKGDKAIYLDKLQKIILTGTPKATAWEEANMIEGREMIFLLDKDRFVANDRVRMKIYPKDKDKKDKKSKLQN